MPQSAVTVESLLNPEGFLPVRDFEHTQYEARANGQASFARPPPFAAGWNGGPAP